MLVLGRVYPIAVVSSFQPCRVALHFCRVGVHAGRLYTHVRTLVLYPARCCDQSHSLTCHMYPHTRYALFPTFAMLPCCHAAVLPCRRLSFAFDRWGRCRSCRLLVNDVHQHLIRFVAVSLDDTSIFMEALGGDLQQLLDDGDELRSLSVAHRARCVGR